MAESIASPRKIRKGTRSCIECRRRKIRCVWLSDDASVCRRCEERGTECTAQTTSAGSPGITVLPSRIRIARLEQQISSLTKALHRVEAQVGLGLTQTHQQQSVVDVNSTISDTETDNPEELAVHEPAYLQSLFNNDLISSANQANDDHRRIPRHHAALMDRARSKLQFLIPVRDDVVVIASFADQWLRLYNALFTAGPSHRTGEGIVTDYDEMQKSTVNPMALAAWLAQVAVSVQQNPERAVNLPSGNKSTHQYCKLVVNMIQQCIIAQNVLLGTVEGLQAAIYTIRVHLSLGDFAKVWTIHRQVVAMAEFTGLPQASQALREAYKVPDNRFTNSNTATMDERKRILKADTWAAICMVDRIASMILNLPAATKRYPMPQGTVIDSNGNVDTHSYLRGLADITTDVHDLNDHSVIMPSDSNLYAQVVEIDSKLNKLAGLVPKSWWNETQDMPIRILQYWHLYTALRTHMPFTLRPDTSHQFDYSRYCCMNACQAIMCRYPDLRRSMPRSFFGCRVIDLQALTATIVYLLTYKKMSSTRDTNLQMQSIAAPETMLPDLIDAMEFTFDQAGSDFAKQAVVTIRSLITLLAGGEQSSTSRDLVLKVPLIGKIHVQLARRVESTVPLPFPQAAREATRQQAADQMYNTPMTPSNMATTTTGMFNQNDVSNSSWLWDPLSWTIEDDRESISQQAMVMDDYGQIDFTNAFNDWA